MSYEDSDVGNRDQEDKEAEAGPSNKDKVKAKDTQRYTLREATGDDPITLQELSSEEIIATVNGPQEFRNSIVENPQAWSESV